MSLKKNKQIRQPVTLEIAGAAPVEDASEWYTGSTSVTALVCRFGNYLTKNKLNRCGGGVVLMVLNT